MSESKSRVDLAAIDRQRQKIMKELLKEFYDSRIEQGLSQGEVGKRCGMSIPEVSRFENGTDRNPTVKLLIKVAAALGRQVKITIE